MAQECGFFNAELSGSEYDRVYLAETFAAYFASFIGNGVYLDSLNELEVLAQDTPNMSVQVLSGQGWINGYWYRNTDAYTLAISVADGILSRIDRIVLRWDNEERDMYLTVLEGTPSSSPVAPSIIRNSDYYDLCLATITVGAGVTTITQSAITDTRSDSTVCGWVTGVIEQIDLTNLYNQWTAYFNEFKETYAADFEEWSEEQQQDFETWSQAQQTSFEAWVETIRDILDETAAGNLQLEIENLQSQIDNDVVHLTGNETIAGTKTFSSPIIATTAIGQKSGETFGTSANAIGKNNIASGYGSNAEGYGTTASGNYSHAEGNQTTASGSDSHAEGNQTTVTSNSSDSHVEGLLTTVSGNHAHAEGNQTTASGQGAHSEGDRTEASGNYSHTEGYNNIASGNYSHAEGNQTTASGIYSHSEGNQTTASDSYSHAEGYGTFARGYGSHTEGNYTVSEGNYSHAEGNQTTASGIYSHSEGNQTTASGQGAHAEGYGTLASGDYQTVVGKYNVEDVNGDFNFIVGAGTSSSNRKNAFSVDKNGNVRIGSASSPVSGYYNGNEIASASYSYSTDFRNTGKLLVNNKILIQWGTYNIGGSSATIVFPTSFNANCHPAVVCSRLDSSDHHVPMPRDVSYADFKVDPYPNEAWESSAALSWVAYGFI